jgi:hypothetical protein
MVAEAEAEMRSDPNVTEHYRRVHRILVQMTLDGHMIRDSTTGRWFLTTAGALHAEMREKG